MGAVAGTWPLITNLGSATLRPGDVWLVAWQINEYHHTLLSGMRGLVDANIYFPYAGTTALNDIVLTHALITLPLAGFDSAVLAHNVAFLLGIVLCAVCAHLFIVELTDAPWAAVVGSVLFALTPFRFLHLGHLTVAAFWPVPLMFWALLWHLRRPSWPRAVLAAGAGMAVVLSSMYNPLYALPLLPLVVLFGTRRGAGGLRAWGPLLAAGTVAMALLVPILLPYADAMERFGVGSAPADLRRYAADVSSLGQRPLYLGGPGNEQLDPEALLYPGAALLGLTALALLLAARSAGSAGTRQRRVMIGVGILVALLASGLVVALSGPLRRAWAVLMLLTLWVAPIGLAVWAVVATSGKRAFGARPALRLGLAGAALSFVFALGPQAHYQGEPIGPAPYALLVSASRVFEGTRVPARFGSLLVLFLALIAAAALLEAGAMVRRRSRAAVAAIAAIALIGTAWELPRDIRLTRVPDLADPVYDWLREQPEPLAVLELPEFMNWRSLRYMLASKQHRKQLVNGTARVEPFLWRDFVNIEPFSDEFFRYIRSYFPLTYVMLHRQGMPADMRYTASTRLQAGDSGWTEVHREGPTRVYTVDRSFDRGRYVDRIYLRRDIAPRAQVRFSARAMVEPATGSTVGAIGDAARDSRVGADIPGGPSRGGRDSVAITVELFQNAEIIEAFEIGPRWRDFELLIDVAPHGPLDDDPWPRPGTLLTWQLRDGETTPFEVRHLSVERVSNR